MGQNYPDQNEFAYTFATAELSASGRIWTAITTVSLDQPTQEAAIRGTKVQPLKRTVGIMELGDGTITFSDEDERMDFIDAQGDAYREKIWGLIWKLRHKKTGRVRTVEAISCRIIGNPLDHEEGSDGLGGDINFSFMDHKINGKRPHS